MQGVLIPVHHEQSRGLEAVDHRTQLRPDGTAGAGDQDPPPLDEAGHLAGVDVDLSTPQEVPECQRADVSGQDLGLQVLGQPRQDQYPQAGSARLSSDGGDLGSGRGRNGDHQGLSGKSCGGLPQGLPAAHHPAAQDAQVSLLRVVVQERHRPNRRLGVPQEGPSGLVSPVSRPEDDGSMLAVSPGNGPQLLHQAHRIPGAEHHQHRRAGAARRGTDRHGADPGDGEEAQREDHPDGHCGQPERPGFLEGGKSEAAGVQPGEHPEGHLAGNGVPGDQGQAAPIDTG